MVRSFFSKPTASIVSTSSSTRNVQVQVRLTLPFSMKDRSRLGVAIHIWKLALLSLFNCRSFQSPEQRHTAVDSGVLLKIRHLSVDLHS
ncbi:hypothetical protein MRX96_029900 [Rhipicephalus microplus]